MECGEGIEERHTQQQHSVPGHAERGEEGKSLPAADKRTLIVAELEQEIQHVQRKGEYVTF